MRRIRWWAIVATGLAAAACARGSAPVAEGPPPARLRALDFAASLGETSPTRLEGEVRITNRGSTPETLVFQDGCPVRLRVYDVDGTRVAPVWEGPETCPGGHFTLAIAPGETEVLTIPPSPTPEILGDELAAGPYRVTVWLEPDHRVIEIEAGVVELTSS